MADINASVLDDGHIALSYQASMLTLESHAIAARAMMVGNEGQFSALPLIGGSVTADAGSVIRRSGSITIHGAWSDNESSALTPYGTRVRVERGIRVSRNTIEWVPLMTGRITDVKSGSADRDEVLELSLKDDMFTVKGNRFDVSTKTNTAETVVAAITRLITETLPGRTVVDLTGRTDMCGAMDLQQERGDAIGKLATSIGASCYSDRTGTRFIIAPTPTFAAPGLWTLAVGETGSVISFDRSRSAEGTYNRVLAYGESATGATDAPPPVSGSAQITDPTDPLVYGGPFGKVTRFYKSPLITTTDQATTAAASLLEKARGRNYSIGFATLVNPALDPDDVIESVLSDGVRRKHIVESVTLPLSTGDSQSVSVRTVDPLPDESA